MAITLVQSNSSFDAASDTSATVALTGVTAGNLIVVYIGWDGWGAGSSDRTVTISDGTTSFTIGTKNLYGDGTGGEPCCYFGWLLNANAGDKTYTATMSGNVVDKVMCVFEFTLSGATWSLDAENATAEGDSSNPTSGQITSTGTDVVCLGGAQQWSTLTQGTWQIGPNAATGNETESMGTAWYRVQTISADDVEVTLTGGSTSWICTAIAFKAAAGGPSSILRQMMQHDGG